MLRRIVMLLALVALVAGCSMEPEVFLRRTATLIVEVQWGGPPAERYPHVEVDGEPVGQAPGGRMALKLPAGPHVVHVYSRGFLPRSRRVVLVAGNTHYVQFHLEATSVRPQAQQPVPEADTGDAAADQT